MRSSASWAEMHKINPPAEEFATGDLVSWTGECYLMSGRLSGEMGAHELTQVTYRETRTGLVINRVGDHIEVMHGKRFYILQLMLPIEKLVVWKEEMWS